MPSFSQEFVLGAVMASGVVYSAAGVEGNDPSTLMMTHNEWARIGEPRYFRMILEVPDA